MNDNYKLFTDRNIDFECIVEVKNANIKNSKARLIVESNDGLNLVFNGKIEGEKCIVPIRKLKGLLEENATGKMFLEMIVDDNVYFRPWTSPFIIEEHTSVKVLVKEQKEDNSNKPIIEVKSVVSQKPSPVSKTKNHTATNEIIKLCESYNITNKNLKKNKELFKFIVKEYFKINDEFNDNKSQILKEVSGLL